METDQLTDRVIASAIKIHRTLGPGLLESAYRECLCYELMKEGLEVEKENRFLLFTKG